MGSVYLHWLIPENDENSLLIPTLFYSLVAWQDLRNDFVG
jgi:hypothetical protein